MSRRLDMLMAWRAVVQADGQSPVPTEASLREVADAPKAWPEAAELEPWRTTLEWLLKQLRLGVADPVEQLPIELKAPAAVPARPEPPAEHRAGPPAEQRAEPRATPPTGGLSYARTTPRRSAAQTPAPQTPAPQTPAPHTPGPHTPGPQTPATPTPTPQPSAPQTPPPTQKAGEPAALTALREWRDKGLARNAPGFARLKESHLKTILASGSRSPEDIAKMLPDAAVRALSGEVARLLETHAGGGTAPAAAKTEAAASLATAMARHEDKVARSEATDAADPQPQSSATAAGPAAAPAPAERDAPPAQAPTPEAFTPFDLAGTGAEPEPLAATPGGDGSMVLTWGDGDPGAYVVYRLVSGDDYPPYSPESGDMVTVTFASTAVDTRAFESAARHYQVWRNSGATQEEALRAQPSLHAAATVVGRVLDLDLRADGGRVIGQWRVPLGVDHVQVYRIPVEKAHRAGLAPEYRVAAGDDNLGGFIDDGVVRGARYVYKICAAARVDGVIRLSAASAVQVAVSAVLEPVDDLTVTQRDDEGGGRAFDLTWTAPPTGHVVIYRTPQPPRAGAGIEAHQESALPQMQLEEKDRLAHPIRAGEDGRPLMRDVPWPDGWTRAYFTPVTTLDGLVRVGVSTSATWISAVRVPRIVERVRSQVLTFAWPPGAASVVAHVGPPGLDAAAARGGRSCEISEAQYRDLGGLTFPFSLPGDGCTVHVVPVAFAAGERVEGPAVSVQYRGLVRLGYRISMKRGFTGKPSALLVDITSEVPVESAPFVLVHNADRLPLDVGDGTALEATREGDETMAVTRRPCPDRLVPGEPSRWRFEAKGLDGYVRLFVDLPPARLRGVAVVDPPVRELRLEPLFGARG